MKVFLGLHKTVDGRWTSTPVYITEESGVLCVLDDGSAVAVAADGRVLRFAADNSEGRELV